jgi:hypothetical protein
MLTQEQEAVADAAVCVIIAAPAPHPGVPFGTAGRKN